MLRSSRPVIVGRTVTNQVLGPRPSGHFSSFSLPRLHPCRSSCWLVQRPSGSEKAPLPLESTVDTLCAWAPFLTSSTHSSLLRSLSAEDHRSRESLPLKHLSRPTTFHAKVSVLYSWASSMLCDAMRRDAMHYDEWVWNDRTFPSFSVFERKHEEDEEIRGKSEIKSQWTEEREGKDRRWWEQTTARGRTSKGDEREVKRSDGRRGEAVGVW